MVTHSPPTTEVSGSNPGPYVGRLPTCFCTYVKEPSQMASVNDAFNTVISRRVVLWAEKTSTYSWCQGSVL